MTDRPNKFLFSKPKKIKDFKHIVAVRKNELWSLDLADYTGNEKATNRGYILVCVDVFSRYLMTCVMKSKTKNELEKHLLSLFASHGIPENIYADQESALIHSDLINEKTNIYHTQNYMNQGSPIAERAISTIKSRIEQLRTDSVARSWKHFVKPVTDEINSTVHRTINMKPDDAIKPENEMAMKTKQMTIAHTAPSTNTEAKYVEGDAVINVAEKKNVFEKGYKMKWEKESKTVTEINTDANGLKTYTLSDGTKWYREQLQKLTKEGKDYLNKHKKK